MGLPQLAKLRDEVYGLLQNSTAPKVRLPVSMVAADLNFENSSLLTNLPVCLYMSGGWMQYTCFYQCAPSSGCDLHWNLSILVLVSIDLGQRLQVVVGTWRSPCELSRKWNANHCARGRAFTRLHWMKNKTQKTNSGFGFVGLWRKHRVNACAAVAGARFEKIGALRKTVFLVRNTCASVASRPWASQGENFAPHPWIFAMHFPINFAVEKCPSLSFELVKLNFATADPPGNNPFCHAWKIHPCPLRKKTSGAHGRNSARRCFAFATDWVLQACKYRTK